jgi:hypothetical protein
MLGYFVAPSEIVWTPRGRVQLRPAGGVVAAGGAPPAAVEHGLGSDSQ